MQSIFPFNRVSLKKKPCNLRMSVFRTEIYYDFFLNPFFSFKRYNRSSVKRPIKIYDQSKNAYYKETSRVGTFQKHYNRSPWVVGIIIITIIIITRVVLLLENALHKIVVISVRVPTQTHIRVYYNYLRFVGLSLCPTCARAKRLSQHDFFN